MVEVSTEEYRRLQTRLKELESAVAECERAEEALRESEERLGSIISSMDDLVFVLDKSGVFLDYYPPVSTPELYAPSEVLLGQSFRDILPPHVVKSLEDAISAVLDTNEVQQFDYSLDMADGERWYSAKVSLRTDSAGEFAGVTIVSRNITRRLRAREALQQYAERLRALATQLADVAEAERQRLARELHDQVGQNLTALGINLNILRAQIPEEAAGLVRSRLNDSLSLVEETAERIRDVMADLRPPVLDDYGLVAALRWYGEQFEQRTEIACVVKGEEPAPRLAARVENALFRIVQEALTNVAKHAQATRVTVTLEVDGGTVRLLVSDDGIGFDPSTTLRTSPPHLAEPDGDHGWGLLTMSERADAVGGRCRIESDPRRGARVIVELAR